MEEVTFGEFRKLAAQRGWSVAWLVEQCKGELDRPTDVIRRVLEGSIIDGKKETLWDVVLPYRCLIELYQRATKPTPALVGEPVCACGCGGKVFGRHKWASPGCRKRIQRKAQTLEKVAV